MKSPLLTALVALVALALGAGTDAAAQVSYSANDVVRPYGGRFRPGVNLGYLPPYTTAQLGELAAGAPAEGIMGVGAKTTRPGLFDVVLDRYGYAVDKPEFEYFEELGMQELTALVGFPNDPNRDYAKKYCTRDDNTNNPRWNEHFQGIYEPIWDDGADGTPYNEDNLYAAYIYNVVETYTDEVRFWEIWNEPGLYKGDWAEAEKFWGGPDYPGSWWVNDPDPCDYYLAAPIEHFVRVLRISYEVIKTISPDDYVTLSGLGSPSFLDAIMRNTDNPGAGDAFYGSGGEGVGTGQSGSVTTEFPLLGGAYFDVMGFHTYPHFDGSTVFGDFKARHSDGAADGIINRALAGYQRVLYDRGYDGATYPAKHHICTEVNIPREAATDQYVAGNEAQLNFIQKCLASFKRNDVYQMHVFSIGDQSAQATGDFEFRKMGLYQQLEGTTPGEEELNDVGIAYKTASDLIYPTDYDPVQTAALQAPDGVRAYAFATPTGGYVYMLWAETRTDRSEQASATFSFPAGVLRDPLVRYEWDYAVTRVRTPFGKTEDIALDATPIYLVDDANFVLPVELASFGVSRTGVTNALAWTTANEVDNSGFEVEHAVGTTEDFEAIGFVEGQGDGADYGFSHATTAAGTHYYRLRQVDFDGTATLSAVVSVSVGGGEEAVGIAPNPVSDELQVYGLAEGTEVTVRDMSGRAVQVYRLDGAGLDVSALASGVYVVTAEGEAPLRFVKR